MGTTAATPSRRTRPPSPRNHPRPPRRTTVSAALAVLAAGTVLLAGCGSSGSEPGDTVAGSPAPAAPTTTTDPATKAYCDTVARVQAEQTSPQAGQGGVQAASAAAAKQVADLVATSPPGIAGDWRTVQQLTDQALGSLAGTGGDPNRIDRDQLARLEAESQPAVERIKEVTSQQCGIVFRPPA